MFSQTWKKYLPVLTLFLKRSAIEPQKVQLNQIDFERALGGRKIKLGFAQLEINKGRINNLIKNTVLAKDLADVLEENDQTRVYLRPRNIAFSLTGNFELQITDLTPAVIAESAIENDDVTENLPGEPETKL
jgi:hypothetical protein